MFGFEGLTDMAKVQMDKARLLCYQYTGNRVTAHIKYAMTYLFHFLPEKFYLFFTALITVVLCRWLENPVGFLRAMDVLGFFYKLLKYPSDIWLSSLCKRKGEYENVVVKLWHSPVIPYHVIVQYMQFNGHICPDPE